MNKFIEFIKKLRGEFKVVLIIVLLMLVHTLYSVIFKDDTSIIERSSQRENISSNSYVSDNSFNNNESDINSKPSSISEAVSKDRPIVLSLEAMKNTIENMHPLEGSVKSIEIATEVENPTIWIYAIIDGERKDDLAKEYCTWLHDNGIMALSVTIMDERAKSKGKLIEIGEHKCIK